MGDYFTKWLEAFCIPDQRVETVADIIIKEVICRYGAFRELHSDQGRNFESQLFQEICRTFEILKTRTTPLHPQSDGFIERSFRTVNRLLKAAVEEQGQEWDQIVPFIMMFYRSTPHSTTKLTPNRLVFGREVQLPLELCVERAPDSEPTVETTDYVQLLDERARVAAAMVRRHLKLAATIQKQKYDQRVKHRQITEQSPVWLYDPQYQRVKKGKLSFPWRGPYLHLYELDQGRHVVQKTSSGKRTVVHKNRLYEFLGKKLPKWIRNAMKKSRRA